jgi:hypothetical protein
VASTPVVPEVRQRRDAGVTLLELLIASGLMLAVSAAALAALDRARLMFDAQPEAADAQQRLRVAHDSLYDAIGRAGAGVPFGPLAGPLSAVLPPIVPYRRGGAADDPARGVYYRADTISVLGVPDTTAVAAVSSVVSTGAGGVVFVRPNCGAGPLDRVCGFTQGMRVLIVDRAGRYDLATVEESVGTELRVSHAGPWAGAYDRGDAAVVEADTRTYFLRTAAGEPGQLAQFDGFATERPVVDHVVSLAFEYYGVPEPPVVDEPVDPLAGSSRASYGPPPPRAGVDDLADTWGTGENCMFARDAGTAVPRLASMGAPPSLVRMAPAALRDGPWCPDASRARYDADLLRIRRVHVRLRVQAASAMVRGPAGVLFSRGGTATQAARLVPDLELAFDVSPRNLHAGR